MKIKDFYIAPFPFFYSYLLPERRKKIKWAEKRIKEGDTLLYLEDFYLSQRCLLRPVWSKSQVGLIGELATVVTTGFEAAPLNHKVRETKNLNVNFEEARDKVEERYRDAGKIDGALFLAPNLQKIWLSNLDISLLNKIT